MSNLKTKSKNKPKLRFAALCRVSTEKQKKGESLAVQRMRIENAVEQLGEIVSWYGGQEHATEGYERTEIDRLLVNAKKGKFDAFICSHADRWSRDNTKSQQGLAILREANVRFFILTTEWDLYNSEHLLFLEMSAAFGAFQSRHQKAKSIESKIERARRNCATTGNLPYGRTFNKKTETWGVDEAAVLKIEEIAQRYLRNEKLADLALEYGIDRSGLHKVLTQRSGDIWLQSFKQNGKIVIVETKVPRLLGEETINAIKRKTQANKTYTHGCYKYSYLLNRKIFCQHCGYALFGQTSLGKFRYYRHNPSKTQKRKCNRPEHNNTIRANDIEDIVVRHLFEMFGNPAKVQKAIEATIPNRQKLELDKKRSERIDTELKKIGRGRDKILQLIFDESITKNQAAKKLDEYKRKEALLEAERSRVLENLGSQPNTKEIKEVAKKVAARFKRYTNIKLMLAKKYANSEFDEMTEAEKKKLLELVFSGKTADGRRMGVYIEWTGKNSWRFSIHGHFVDETGLLLMSDSRKEAWFGDFSGSPHKQKELLTKSASY